ncbi:DUF6319 family protein [Amycolatopsis cihanbeyliensis]|uniref:Uncharacterized protein n=1 Tax=Amycolatopsis cihanbeyliensis TaxID=1128664 RepID=A0A542DMY2_AMYCI|nr:DUF6319 family protein [Amycolatopsis cihanbeyliensis]TQJ04452.1 hypothetical protein FB471_4246 [Amycolatopsis cihanbeyliensis]
MTVDSLTEQQEETSENQANGEVSDSSSDADDTTGNDPTSNDSEGNQDAATADEQAKPKRGRPKGANAKKTRTVELTLTVTGTADGEWQAELKHGSKWVTRGLEIPAAAVSRAAKELHIELSGPIDEVINAAREQQQAKVAQLEAELEQAKQALAELES